VKIVICSSITFRNRYLEVTQELEENGIAVDVPELQKEMPIEQQESDEGEERTSIRGFFESQGGVDAFSPDHEIWEDKARAMREHIERIDAGDAILVTNYSKNGIENYIGANTFLEMFYAFLKEMPIFVLYPLPDMRCKEELLGMQPTVINGDLSEIYGWKLHKPLQNITFKHPAFGCFSI